MKILTVSDVFFPRVNGVSTSIATFHEEYRKRGHEAVLYAPTYANGFDTEAGIGAEANGSHGEVRRLPSRRIPFDPEDRMMSGRRLLTQADALTRERFDVLHIQTPFIAHRVGVPLARRLGIPVVETYHTYFEQYLYHYIPFLPKALMRRIARSFSRRQCNQVDGVIVPSVAMLEVLRAYGVRSRMEKIPTGLRLEEFRAGNGMAFKKRHGIDPDRKTLVHIGRVAFEKNIDFLLHVLDEVRGKVPNILLIIAGEGPAESHLHGLTQKLGLQDHVLFVGYQDRASALLDCYRAGDLFVFASKTETQGLVLLEAMALGVPVVSLAAMGTKDILTPQQGAVIAEEQTEDFARKIVQLLDDEPRRQQMARDAVDYAATWSAGQMAERALDFYHRLAAPTS